MQTVLLLHGQPGSAADWDRVRVELGGRARAIAIDRPGWDGHSRARDLGGNVDAALAELDAIDVERAVVAGHSLGAAVALRLAVDHPERVSALVLVAPAANPAAVSPALDRWLAAPVVGELSSAAGLAGAGLALALPPLRRRLAARAGLDARYVASAGRRLLSPATWRAFVDEQRTLLGELPALERRLDQIDVPTTILTGTRDRIVPRRAAPALAARVSGAVLIAAEGGHMLPQREPRLVADAIARVVAPLSGNRTTEVGGTRAH